jgi:7,8-dihydropterin-6-yl-methyl-4-(beta-D-ribofuranosyl)aminobenzene 5'-phosphate synthase
VKSLVDNAASSDKFECEHGLSVYIETSKHKILFDMGQNNGTFLRNAEKLGIDLSRVDFAVVSHGHFDHGGGLSSFLDLNKTAKVYVHRRAFEKHFIMKPDGSPFDIGLNDKLANHDRVVLVDQPKLELDKQVFLFSGVTGKKFYPADNKRLMMKSDDGSAVPDAFVHEQNLLVCDEPSGVRLLLGGCAHNGIQNILDRAAALGLPAPTHVVGGLHLTSPLLKVDEDPAIVRELASNLLTTKAKFYTGHCTGMGSYKVLKEAMGEYIDYLSSGMELELTDQSRLAAL